MNRRDFVKTAALAPGAAALGGTALAQVPAAAPPAAAPIPAPAGAGSVRALAASFLGEPFARPIVFARNKIAPKLKPFPLNQVRLGDGPFRAAHDANAAYMKRLAPERLLHSFRVNAGIASSAEPLGGWEEPAGELRGHFVGHYLSGCALGFASMGDGELKRRGDLMVAALAECQAKLNQGGYLSAYPIEFYDRLEALKVYVWAPFYTMHKMLAGLHDMHVHAGNAQALQVLLGMAAWVDAWTAAKTEEHMQRILNVEFGGMAEALYNLADTTGDDRWARTGDRFTKKPFLNPLAQAQDDLHNHHANTHIPQVIGAARRYELSQDHRFGDAAKFFWQTVADNRTYVTGGTSNRENWLATPSRLSDEFGAASNHQECCCAYNMLRLTRTLFGWNPSERYMDYYERNLFNTRLGTIDPKTGMNMYLLSITSGSWRAWGGETDTFWCCNGSAVEEYNKLSDTIYFNDGRNVWVNLFINADLDWKERGIRLSQRTQFPSQPRTRLVVEQAPAGSWALNLRIPAWTTEGARVTVNGKALDAAPTPGSYMKISRGWKKGDVIVLEMPMPLRKEILHDDPSLQAVLAGPIVLAGQFALGNPPLPARKPHGPNVAQSSIPIPELAIRARAPETFLTPTGEPLTWRTTGLAQNIVFKPFHLSNERYAVYWKTV